ncbi:MAG: hypothetical protein KIG81_00270 [Thermoguttaceae bacterium]|nr:hypothetical protein [Thermoguttaceae bacterium]
MRNTRRELFVDLEQIGLCSKTSASPKPAFIAIAKGLSEIPSVTGTLLL